MKIFISIASYRDPFLPYTVMSAYQNAINKDNLFFGIVEHAHERQFFNINSFSFKKQIRYYCIDPIYATGVCAARHLAQTLYDSETYFLQIDSHTVFEPGWDEYLIVAWEKLKQNHIRPIISGCPRRFVIPNHQMIHHIERQDDSRFLVLRVYAGESFKENDDYMVLCDPVAINMQNPVYGFYAQGNSLFTTGNMVNEVPYDPHLYFYGEEQSLSLRLWTNGYDIVHIRQLPFYACYDRDYRVLHWTDPIDAERPRAWWQIERQARWRLKQIVTGQLQGIYGVGKLRSIQAYADFCGIDYLNHKIESRAITGDGFFCEVRSAPSRSSQSAYYGEMPHNFVGM